MDEDELKELTKNVQDMIAQKGCVLPLSVKVKPFTKKQEGLLAQYRTGSQFKSKPAFWLNERFPDLIKDEDMPDTDSLSEVVEDKLIREYARTISEWGEKRDKDLIETIHMAFTNEEDFMEGFVGYVKGWNMDRSYDWVMEKYCKSRFSDDEKEE